MDNKKENDKGDVLKIEVLVNTLSGDKTPTIVEKLLKFVNELDNSNLYIEVLGFSIMYETKQ